MNFMGQKTLESVFAISIAIEVSSRPMIEENQYFQKYLKISKQTFRLQTTGLI